MHRKKSVRTHAKLLTVFPLSGLKFGSGRKETFTFYFINFCEVRNFDNEYINFVIKSFFDKGCLRHMFSQKYVQILRSNYHLASLLVSG